MSHYLAKQGSKFADARQRDKLLYWYVHSFLWGRFAGSTESVINQDLRVLDGAPDEIDRLIDQLRRSRGDLLVRPEDFGSWSLSARFYPMLYLLTRVGGARDWGNGLPLSANMLGKFSALQVHHIFPKAVLYPHKYSRSEVNAVANFCFQTQDTNLDIGSKPPAQYFEEIEQKYPGALASQWIPLDRDLWQVERYRDFLSARRALLAESTNQFLDSLLLGTIPDKAVTTPVLERSATAPSGVQVISLAEAALTTVPGSIDSEDEERVLREFNTWVVQHGLAEGQYMYELAHPMTGEPLAILDLAWPRGLQEGLTDPVALLINEEPEILELVQLAQFRHFTRTDAFRAYIEQQILTRDVVVA